MSDIDIPSKDLEIIKGMKSILNLRRSQYGPVLMSTVLTKVEDSWRNALTRIEPQYRNSEKKSAIVYNYNDLIAAKIWLDIEEVILMLDNIFSGQITIKGLPVIDFQGRFQIGPNESFSSSSNDVLQLDWPANVYHLIAHDEFKGKFPQFPIVTLKSPLFPGQQELLKNWCNIDVSRYTGYWNSIVFVLPSFQMKIEDAILRSDQLSLQLKVRDTDVLDIIGKTYYENFGTREVKQHEFEVEATSLNLNLDFEPDWLNIFFLSKNSGETLDFRRMHISMPSRESGVTIQKFSDDIEEVIARGENVQVEFKAKLSDNNREVVETLVSFSNTEGGIILFGVDDNGEIIGEYKDIEGRIMDMVSNSIEPAIIPTAKQQYIKDKPIFIVHVEEGDNKPYNYRNRGVFIRKGSTDRIASRYELDAFYQEKNSSVVKF